MVTRNSESIVTAGWRGDARRETSDAISRIERFYSEFAAAPCAGARPRRAFPRPAPGAPLRRATRRDAIRETADSYIEYTIFILAFT